MLTARFDDGKPKRKGRGRRSRRKQPNPVNEVECRALADDLIELILLDSGILDHFGPIAKHRNNYSEYGELIQNLIDGRLYNEEDAGRTNLAFMKKLQLAHQGYVSKQKIWSQAMGLITEMAFLGLMHRKYDIHSKKIYHEHIATVSNETSECGMDRKPIDVIMWCDCNKNGEFLEIKKNLKNKIEIVKNGEEPGLVEKIKLMYGMLSFLHENDSKSSIVGLATLSKNPFAIRLVEVSLQEAGVLGSQEEIDSLEYQMTVITSDDVVEWYTNVI